MPVDATAGRGTYQMPSGPVRLLQICGYLAGDRRLPESPLPRAAFSLLLAGMPGGSGGAGLRLPSGAGGGSCRFPRDRKALGSSSDTARTRPEARANLCTVEYAMAAGPRPRLRPRRRCRHEPEPEPQRRRPPPSKPRAAPTASARDKRAWRPRLPPREAMRG